MRHEPPTRQQLNAELAMRSLNNRAKRHIKQHTPQEEQSNLKIDFYCECSDENCQERVRLTLQGYEKMHKNRAQFVLAKGHEEPKIEATVANKPGATVVEKYILR